MSRADCQTESTQDAMLALRRLPIAAPSATRAASTQAQLFPSIKRLSELVLASGSGCRVTTTTGETFMDFTSGIGVTSTGHCHPRVVEAVRAQAGTLTHGQMSVAYAQPMLDLIDRLTPLMPKAEGAAASGLDSFFFANSGAEAVEAALRLARQATGRDNVIAFSGGYHGRTSATVRSCGKRLGGVWVNEE